MMRLTISAGWLFLLQATTLLVSAQNCAAPPLNLPIREVSVGPGILSHGISVKIGTPFQHVALVPSLQLDYTFIPRFSNSCVTREGNATVGGDVESDDDSHDISGGSLWRRDGPARFDSSWNKPRDWIRACAALYGGGFKPSLSRSFTDNGTNDQINEEWFRRIRYSGWHFVTERVAFADYLNAFVESNNGAVPENKNSNITTTLILPELGATFGNISTAALSLTPNSTFLEALVNERIIPSKSWSLAKNRLCFGCIDDYAHKGDFLNFKAADRKGELPCLVQRKVVALNYYPNAETEGASLIDKTFTTCIDPGVTTLILPSDVRKNLPGVLGREVQAEYADSTIFKGPSKEDKGCLSFVLEGDFRVNITLAGAGTVGGEETGQWKIPIGDGNWGGYGKDVPVLGRPFTNQIIMRWDERSQEYGVANGNSDADEVGSLKPLGCDDFPDVHKQVETTPKIGVIVGSILGGFASGLFFALAGVFFFRRGQRGVKSRYEPMRDEDGIALRAVSTDGRETGMSGALPAPSLRESIKSRFRSRSPSLNAEAHLKEDGELFEAPEGGTAFPTKRERGELLQVYSIDHR